MICAGGQRKKRAAPRQRRQAAGAGGEEEEEDVEAEFNPENPYQVSHTNKQDSHGSTFSSSLYVRPRRRDCPIGSEGYLRRLFPRRISHSCASGSRCRGYGGGARIVTANLSVCVGVLSVLAFPVRGCPKHSFQH